MELFNFAKNQINNLYLLLSSTQIPGYDLIFNLAKFKKDFLEDTNSNKYDIYVFLLLKGNKEYSLYKQLEYEFNIKAPDNIELWKNNVKGKILDLRLFIKQKSRENELPCNFDTSTTEDTMSNLQDLGFTCLDGYLKDGKLERLVYKNQRYKPVAIVDLDSKLKIDPGAWNKLISERQYFLGLNKIESKSATINKQNVKVSFEKSFLLDKGEKIGFDPVYILMNFHKLDKKGYIIF